jgi:hypothetical protein
MKFMSEQKSAVQPLERLNRKKEILLNCFPERRLNELVEEITVFLQGRNLDATGGITMDLIEFTLLSISLDLELKTLAKR